SDMAGNLKWARLIAGGDWLGLHPWHPYHGWMQPIAPISQWIEWWGGELVFQQAPLYPYWLAGMLTFIRGHFDWIRIVQHGIGIGSGIILYLAAKKLMGSSGAFFAGLLGMLYFPFVCYEYFFLRDFLAVHFLCWIILWVVVSRQNSGFIPAFLAGLFLGFGILTRENFLILAPFLFLFLQPSSRGFSLKKTASSLAGMLLALAPLFIRNGLCGLPVLSLSNRLIESLIEGNAFDSTPCYMCLPDSMGHYLKEGRGDFFRTLWLIISGYPDRFGFVIRQIQKILCLFDFLEPYNNLNLYYFLKTFSWLNVLPNYPHLFLLAVPGFLYVIRGGKHLFLAKLFLLLTLSLILAPVLARYRLVLIPFYCLWGGLTVSLVLKKIHPAIGRILIALFLLLPWTGYLINKTIPDRFKERDTESTVFAIIQKSLESTTEKKGGGSLKLRIEN
ncbi:MAG: glycosyltransferase family 39 protein, partial [Candidatus Aureabacteria bacterium]|nr:glycosyltransferase family 39 protein [Candidatus Auribacterota bacterium]